VSVLGMGVVIEPYVNQLTAVPSIAGLSRRLPRSRLSYDTITYGVKSTFQFVTQGGVSSKFWIDDGFTSMKGKSAPFRVLGSRFVFPALRRTLTAHLPSWIPLSNKQPRIPIVCMTSISASRVLGEGVMPLLHLVKVGASRLLRGHSDRPKHSLQGAAGGGGGAAAANVDERVTGYVALHGDIYIGDVLGTFIDTGLYSGTSSQELTASTSLGVSVRSRGLRCDVAWALGGDPSRPRIHFSADTLL